LLVELIAHYTSLGYRVGSVKHAYHRHELDTPGKDSYRHRRAGAAVTAIVSPVLNAAFWAPDTTDPPDAIYDEIGRLFGRCDFVLVEGHSQIEGAKVEVWRASASPTPLAAGDRSIMAVVTDDPLEAAVPVWSRSDVPRLAERLLELIGM